MTIRLVTDSASDLPQEWIDEFDITVVHLHVVEESASGTGRGRVTAQRTRG